MEVAVNTLMDEQALVARASIDPVAFAEIYDHYFPRIYNYVSYRVRDAEAADDITAQVFERALDKVQTYRSEVRPLANWLFGIARNAVRDHARAQKRRGWLSLNVLIDQASTDPRPEELAMRGETREQLRAAVAALGEREREIIALRFGGGLTNRAIAELTGMSESNVGVVLHRSIGRLRGMLGGEEAEE